MKYKLKSCEFASGFTVQVKNPLSDKWNDFDFFYDSEKNKFVCNYNNLLSFLKQGYVSIRGQNLAELVFSPKWHLIAEIIDIYKCELYWRDFKKFLQRDNWRIKALQEGGE